MEQSEAYKEAVETIKALEMQLSLCASHSSIWEHSLAEAEQQIEEYFEKMVNALAARKAALEGEIAQKNATRKAVMEEHRRNLEISIEGCKTTMKGAAVLQPLNPSAAAAILKSIKNTSIPTIDAARVVVELSPTLFDVINDIGKDSNPENWISVQIESPRGICFNIHDNCLYICGDERIYKVTLQGEITTFAECEDNYNNITYNSLERLFYVTGYERTISKVSPFGEISLFAGTAHTSGNKDAIGAKATFESPFGLAFDRQTGNLYVSDRESNRIRKITAKGFPSCLLQHLNNLGEVTTIVGGFFGSPLSIPHGMCFDERDGSLLVCDYGNNNLVRVKLDGKVSVLCNIDGPESVAMNGADIYVISFRQLLRVSQTDGSTWTTTTIAQFKLTKRFSLIPITIAIHEGICFVVDYSTNQICKTMI